MGNGVNKQDIGSENDPIIYPPEELMRIHQKRMTDVEKILDEILNAKSTEPLERFKNSFEITRMTILTDHGDRKALYYKAELSYPSLDYENAMETISLTSFGEAKLDLQIMRYNLGLGINNSQISSKIIKVFEKLIKEVG